MLLIPFSLKSLSSRRHFRASPLSMRTFAKVVGTACAIGLIAGCSDAPTHKDDSDFVYLLDRKPNWVEIPVTTLPALPNAADVLPFDVSSTSPLKFGIDAKSVTVGEDGVVRYTAVITSPAGARNVYYEGIRCDNYTWRLYAAANDAGTGWDRSVANDWQRIPTSELNSYQGALYEDYMCASRLPTGNAKGIVDRIRFHRIAQDEYH